MRQVIIDKTGTPRFKENSLVRLLLDEAGKKGIRFHEWFCVGDNVCQEDVDEFYQLIGYSVGGYCECEMVSDKSVEKAVEAAKKLGFPWQQGEKTVNDWLKNKGYAVV